jgi:lysozyme family protein
MLGGGFADTFDQVHDGVEKALKESGGAKVAWVRHDGTKPAPPLGPEYGKAMVERVKETLASLKAEGKLESSNSGVYWF